MKSNKIFKTFFRFLKERHLLNRFLENIKDHINNTNFNLPTDYINRIPIHNTYECLNHRITYQQYTKLIDNFYFTKTKEGIWFWIDVERKWLTIYEKIRREDT